MRTIASLVLLVGLPALISFDADADSGDLSIGGGLAVGVTDADGDGGLILAPDVQLRIGVLDWLHFDGAAGFVSSVSEGHTVADVRLGLTAALDVFSWVPEFSLGGVLWLNRDFLFGPAAGLRVRYHLDAQWSLAGGGEIAWLFAGKAGGDGGFHLSGSVSVLYALD